MDFEVRVKEVMAELARLILLARVRDSRPALAPLRRARSAGAPLDVRHRAAVADAAQRLQAHAKVGWSLDVWDEQGIITNRIDADEKLCFAVSDELRGLSEALVANPNHASVLLDSVEARIEAVLPDLDRLEAYRQRTFQAARDGDPVAGRAVEIMVEFNWDELADISLDKPKASERYAASVLAV